VKREFSVLARSLSKRPRALRYSADSSFELSSNEFDLWCALRPCGQIQSRESLYRQLYHREYDGLDRTLDVRVSHLRRKLGDEAVNSERIKPCGARDICLYQRPG